MDYNHSELNYFPNHPAFFAKALTEIDQSKDLLIVINLLSFNFYLIECLYQNQSQWPLSKQL